MTEVEELRETLKRADEVFRAANALSAKLGDPVAVKNKRIENELVALEHTLWRYANA